MTALFKIPQPLQINHYNEALQIFLEQDHINFWLAFKNSSSSSKLVGDNISTLSLFYFNSLMFITFVSKWLFFGDPLNFLWGLIDIMFKYPWPSFPLLEKMLLDRRNLHYVAVFISLSFFGVHLMKLGLLFFLIVGLYRLWGCEMCLPQLFLDWECWSKGMLR